MKPLNPFTLFLVKGLAFFFFWCFFTLNHFNVHSASNDFLVTYLQHFSLFISSGMGFDVFEVGHHFGLVNSTGVILGPPCNGLSLMFVFSAFFLAFPSSNKFKYIWILSGIVGIQILNVIRIVSLMFLSKYAPNALSFNHDYTFTLLMYGLIFLTWYVYVQYYSRTN